MKMRNLFITGVALLCTVATMAGVPTDIGAIMGKSVKLYPQHNAGNPDLSSPKGITLDYKLVTLDNVSYVYLKASNGNVPGADWGMQYRYWSEAMGKTENNLLNKFATYATQVVTTTMPNPLKYISFYVSIEGDSETDFITYDPKKFNSVDESDKVAPSITEVEVVPSIFTANLNITGDDEDAFYYIEDAAHNYKSIAIIKNATLTGLAANTTYNLTITPVDFNGNRGASISKSFTTKADIQEITVPVTTATFNCAEAGAPLFEEVTDPEKGTVVHVKATDGMPWAMIQANKPLAEGLGATGKEFSYVHVIAKCAKAGQVIRGSFNGEIAMKNPFIPANEWQDIIFEVGKTKINDIVIYLDYYGDGKGGTFPKELWLKEVVFNNSATPLIEAPEDKVNPVLNSISLVENSVTYSSAKINVSATDNIGVVGYVVKDETNGYNKSLIAANDIVTIDGLSPGTTYNFSVQAKDAAGNLSNVMTLNNVTTVDRQSECSGDLGHFGTPDIKKIHYEITYEDGDVTFTINPIGDERILDFAQVQLFDKGFEGMKISDGGKTASFTYKGGNKGDVYYAMFVYSLDDMGGNEQTAENTKIDGRVFYIVGDCEVIIPDDTEKPILTSATVVDGSTTYNSVKLNVVASDNIGVTSFVVKDEVNNFNTESKAFGGVISITGLNPATTYNFSIQAKDLAGNLSDALAVNNITTVARPSECSGELGHFSPADAEKMVYYEISYRNGSITYRLEPCSSNSNYADKKLNFAQVRTNINGVYSGFDGMKIAEDGKSATFTLNNVTPGEIVYNMFVFGFEGNDAHYQSSENENLNGYIFYIAGDCAGALEKTGTETDPVLSGEWNADTFAGYNLNYANITTLDMTEVMGMAELPVMTGLNTNCLIYVNKNSNISDATKNIVVFDKGVGSATNIILNDGYSFNNTKEFNAEAISYTRDFTDMNGWASICLPFAVDVTGREIEQLSKFTDNSFQFTLVEGNTVPNVPYIMAVKDMAKEAITGSGIVPVSTLNSVQVNEGAYTFAGTYNEVSKGSANGLYLLRTEGNEFAVGSAESYVPAFRAYITASSPAAPERINVMHNAATNLDAHHAEAMLIWSENGVLKIVVNEAKTVKIYSLDGCVIRDVVLNEGYNTITGLSQGIYVVNNRKVVIK